MNVLFTDAITVYNHRRDPDTEIDYWRRTVIEGAQWAHGKRQINIVNGVATESIVESLTIDFSRSYGRKAYLDPITYKKLSASEAESYWTLDPQCKMDYIVLGKSDFEITRPAQLGEAFQYWGMVAAVSDNRNRPRLQHIRAVVK